MQTGIRIGWIAGTGAGRSGKREPDQSGGDSFCEWSTCGSATPSVSKLPTTMLVVVADLRARLFSWKKASRPRRGTRNCSRT